MPEPAPPAGYVARHQGDHQAWVWGPEAEVISAALFLGQGCRDLSAGGRGNVSVFPLAQGEGIIRHYRRGGLAGKFMKDSYYALNRPMAEFLVHKALRDKGVPCPELLGVVWSRTGNWYQGSIATRRIEGVSLLDLLLGTAKIEPALNAAGRAIRQLHDAGGVHPDLHPGNIMVALDGAFLLDFDRARVAGALLPAQRWDNLLRLRRSFLKQGIPLGHLQMLMDAYGEIPPPAAWQRSVASIREAWVQARYRKGERGDTGT